jgi:hypothetical protein
VVYLVDIEAEATLETLPSYLVGLEVFFASWFGLDLLVRFFATPDRLEFLYRSATFVDVLSILPIVTIIFDLPTSLAFVRIIRALRLTRISHLFRVLDSGHQDRETFADVERSIRKQIMSLTFTILSFLFVAAGVSHAIEQLQPGSFARTTVDTASCDFDAYDAQGIPSHLWPAHCRFGFLDALYLAVITAGTIGYGDIVPVKDFARVVIILQVAILFIIIPRETSKLSELLSRSTPYAKPLLPGLEGHVVLCGDLSVHAATRFLAEFFHEDHGAVARKKVAILRSTEPSSEWIALIHSPRFEGSVQYVLGSALVAADLDRVGITTADAVFVMTSSEKNRAPSLAFDADSVALLTARSVRDASPRVPVILQLLRQDSMERNSWANADLVVCRQSLRMSVLAMSVLYPGIATFLSNIVSSFSDREAERFVQGTASKVRPGDPVDDETESFVEERGFGPASERWEGWRDEEKLAGLSAARQEARRRTRAWRVEYARSMGQEVYSVPISPFFVRRSFEEVAVAVHRAYGCVMFAVETQRQSHHPRWARAARGSVARRREKRFERVKQVVNRARAQSVPRSTGKTATTPVSTPKTVSTAKAPAPKQRRMSVRDTINSMNSARGLHSAGGRGAVSGSGIPEEAGESSDDTTRSPSHVGMVPDERLGGGMLDDLEEQDEESDGTSGHSEGSAQRGRESSPPARKLPRRSLSSKEVLSRNLRLEGGRHERASSEVFTPPVRHRPTRERASTRPSPVVTGASRPPRATLRSVSEPHGQAELNDRLQAIRREERESARQTGRILRRGKKKIRQRDSIVGDMPLVRGSMMSASDGSSSSLGRRSTAQQLRSLMGGFNKSPTGGGSFAAFIGPQHATSLHRNSATAVSPEGAPPASSIFAQPDQPSPDSSGDAIQRATTFWGGPIPAQPGPIPPAFGWSADARSKSASHRRRSSLLVEQRNMANKPPATPGRRGSDLGGGEPEATDDFTSIHSELVLLMAPQHYYMRADDRVLMLADDVNQALKIAKHGLVPQKTWEEEVVEEHPAPSPPPPPSDDDEDMDALAQSPAVRMAMAAKSASWDETRARHLSPHGRIWIAKETGSRSRKGKGPRFVPSPVAIALRRVCDVALRAMEPNAYHLQRMLETSSEASIRSELQSMIEKLLPPSTQAGVGLQAPTGDAAADLLLVLEPEEAVFLAALPECNLPPSPLNFHRLPAVLREQVLRASLPAGSQLQVRPPLRAPDLVGGKRSSRAPWLVQAVQQDCVAAVPSRLKGHIIVAGDLAGIVDFVHPLRRATSQVIVVLAPRGSLSSSSDSLVATQWKLAKEKYGNLIHVDGSPLRPKDLVRAGVQRAGCVLVLSSDSDLGDEEAGQGNGGDMDRMHLNGGLMTGVAAPDTRALLTASTVLMFSKERDRAIRSSASKPAALTEPAEPVAAPQESFEDMASALASSKAVASKLVKHYHSRALDGAVGLQHTQSGIRRFVQEMPNSPVDDPRDQELNSDDSESVTAGNITPRLSRAALVAARRASLITSAPSFAIGASGAQQSFYAGRPTVLSVAAAVGGSPPTRPTSEHPPPPPALESAVMHARQQLASGSRRAKPGASEGKELLQGGIAEGLQPMGVLFAASSSQGGSDSADMMMQGSNNASESSQRSLPLSEQASTSSQASSKARKEPRRSSTAQPFVAAPASTVNDLIGATPRVMLELTDDSSLRFLSSTLQHPIVAQRRRNVRAALLRARAAELQLQDDDDKTGEKEAASEISLALEEAGMGNPAKMEQRAHGESVPSTANDAARLRPHFASGKVFLGAMVDSLSTGLLFNPLLLRVITQLLYGASSSGALVTASGVCDPRSAAGMPAIVRTTSSPFLKNDNFRALDDPQATTAAVRNEEFKTPAAASRPEPRDLTSPTDFAPSSSSAKRVTIQRTPDIVTPTPHSTAPSSAAASAPPLRINRWSFKQHDFLRQLAVPDSFHGRRYHSLFQFLVMEHRMIPLAVFRSPEALGAPSPYVVTNPRPDLRLHHKDRVFVLCGIEHVNPSPREFREGPLWAEDDPLSPPTGGMPQVPPPPFSEGGGGVAQRHSRTPGMSSSPSPPKETLSPPARHDSYLSGLNVVHVDSQAELLPKQLPRLETALDSPRSEGKSSSSNGGQQWQPLPAIVEETSKKRTALGSTRPPRETSSPSVPLEIGGGTAYSLGKTGSDGNLLPPLLSSTIEPPSRVGGPQRTISASDDERVWTTPRVTAGEGSARGSVASFAVSSLSASSRGPNVSPSAVGMADNASLSEVDASPVVGSSPGSTEGVGQISPLRPRVRVSLPAGSQPQGLPPSAPPLNIISWNTSHSSSSSDSET